MDAGSVSKPVVVQVTTTEIRPQAQTGAQPTTLPADQAVTQSAAAERTRLPREDRRDERGQSDVSPAPKPVAPAVERKTTIDDESGRVLVQAVHASSGEVIWQLPAETILKLGVYARELGEADGNVDEASASKPNFEKSA